MFGKDAAGANRWGYPPGFDSANPSTLNARNWPDGAPFKMGDEATVLETLDFSKNVMEALLRQSGRTQFAQQCSCGSGGSGFPFRSGSMAPTNWSTRKPDCCLAFQTRVPNVDSGDYSIRHRQVENANQAVKLWNPGCMDVLGKGEGLPYYNLILHAMADAVNAANQSACGDVQACPTDRPMCYDGACVSPTCEKVELYCALPDVAGERTRQLCPETCGCADPTSQRSVLSGCGETCLRSGRFLAKLEILQCVDRVVNDPELMAFADDIERMSVHWPTDWGDQAMMTANGIRTYGCAYLSNSSIWVTGNNPPMNTTAPPFVFGTNFCAQSAIFFPSKPIAAFCPVACGCHSDGGSLTSERPWCPKSCPSRSASTPTCPDAMRSSLMNGYTNSDFCPITSPSAGSGA